jgi:hypothetical protein
VTAMVSSGRIGELDTVMASCNCTRFGPAADIVVVVAAAAMVVLADVAAGHTGAVGNTAAVEDRAAAEGMCFGDRMGSAGRMAEQTALVAYPDFQRPRPQRPRS